MKAHLGADSKTKLIHTAVATLANAADSTVFADLLPISDKGKECTTLMQDHTHSRYLYKNGIDENED